MSLSSEKIYKRKSSIISVRQQLLKILLRKYIKKVYYGVLAANKTKQLTTKKNKSNDRQLLRHEYYNDINECLLNYCQLKNLTSAKNLKTSNSDHKLTSQREFIESIKSKSELKKVQQSVINTINATKKTSTTFCICQQFQPNAIKTVKIDCAENVIGEFSR